MITAKKTLITRGVSIARTPKRSSFGRTVGARAMDSLSAFIGLKAISMKEPGRPFNDMGDHLFRPG